MNIMFNFRIIAKNKIIKKLSYQSHFPFLKEEESESDDSHFALEPVS